MLCIIQCLFHTLFEACTLHRWQLFHPRFLHACCSVRVRQARQHLFAPVSFRCWYKSCLMDSSSRSKFLVKNVDCWGIWTCFVCHLPICSSNGKKHNHSAVSLKVLELVLNGRQALHTLFLRWMSWTTWLPRDLNIRMLLMRRFFSSSGRRSRTGCAAFLPCCVGAAQFIAAVVLL